MNIVPESIEHSGHKFIYDKQILKPVYNNYFYYRCINCNLEVCFHIVNDAYEFHYNWNVADIAFSCNETLIKRLLE